jgi:hypothetical protein
MKGGGMVGFLEELRKITDDSKKGLKVQRLTDAEKEAEKIIEVIKDKVTEEAQKGKEEAVVRVEWGKTDKVNVEMGDFRALVIEAVANYFRQEGFKIKMNDSFGWTYNLYIVYLSWAEGGPGV